MHTTICAFDERADAEQAMELLVQAGFPRHDMYVEHRGATSEGPRTRWGSRLPAGDTGDRGTLEAFGRFMASLLGEDNESGHTDTYSQHVERGSHVLVVDARSEEQAELVRRLLRELDAEDLHVLDRGEQRPLRDIVGMPQGRSDLVERRRESWEWAPDRASAANRRDDDVQRPPGLRDADDNNKDKPNR